jgi:hypothetical protein
MQFPPMRHDWQHHNSGFWVMGLLAVGVVGLPLYPSTNMIENIRSYNFGFWVLGQPRWRRSKGLISLVICCKIRVFYSDPGAFLYCI